MTNTGQPAGGAYPPPRMRVYRSAIAGPEEQHPPRAPRHRGGRRLRINARWLLVFSVLSLLLAWNEPLTVRTLRLFAPRRPAAPREAQQFMALAYVAPGTPSGISVPRFAEHVDQLKAAGYVPLTLTEVRGLLQQGRPLPLNGVLLTIDHPHANSFRALSSILRRHGWNAVAFLNTGKTPHGAAPPSWRTLRMGVGEGRWEVGSMGQSGGDTIPVDAKGTQKPFLTHLQWLPGPRRPETVFEYQRRLQDDLNDSLARIRLQLQRQAVAYAFPNGNFGQLDDTTPLENLLRLATAGQLFEMAFIRGITGGNTRTHDPMRLNRLTVHPDWTGADLLHRLHTRQVAARVQETRSAPQVEAFWLAASGEVQSEAESAWRFRVEEGYGPVLAWLTEPATAWRALEINQQFQLSEGALRLYLYGDPRLPERLYLEIGENGHVHLAWKSNTGDTEILAEGRAPVHLNHEQQLRLLLRDRMLAVWVDDVPAFDFPPRVPDPIRGHAIGVGLAPMPGFVSAQATVREIEISRPPLYAAFWARAPDAAPVPSLPLTPLRRQAERYALISPPWPHGETTVPGPCGSTKELSPLLRQLARIHRAELIPHINLPVHRDPFIEYPPEAWAQSVAKRDCDGVLIRFTGSGSRLTLGDISSWLATVERILVTQGKSLWVRLPAALEQVASVQALAGYLPRVGLVLASENAPAWADSLTVPVIYEEQLDAESAWPLYLNLRADTELTDRENRQLRIVQTAEDGDAAMHAGRYDQAIVHYSDWMDLDPDNPEPLNRISDALLRLRYRDEAADFLEQSLELEPEQLERLVQLTGLLDEIGRGQDARLWLNRYALLYPRDLRILLAQAEWLYRRNRYSETRDRVLRMLAEDDSNLQGALLLLRVASNATERRAALRALQRQIDWPERHAPLVIALRDLDILALPDARPLLELVRQIEQETMDVHAARVARSLMPVYAALAIDRHAERIPEAWHLEGAHAAAGSGGLRLTALPDRSAFSLSPPGSQQWQDAYVQVRADIQRGEHWLVARRSPQHFIRAGVSRDDGRVEVQVWQRRDQEWLITQRQTAPWPHTAPVYTLRLEVRGHGAMVLIDDSAMFATPLRVPREVSAGRVSLEISTAEPGLARATLHALEAGPIPPRIAIVDGTHFNKAAAQIEPLKADQAHWTDLAPDWFELRDGQWHSPEPVDGGLYRTFANLYGLRFTPLARVDHWEAVTLRDIRALLDMHQLDGLVLMSAQPVTREHQTAWREADDAVRPAFATVTRAEAAKDGTLCSVGALRVWMQGEDEGVPVRFTPLDEWQRTPDTHSMHPIFIEPPSGDTHDDHD